MRKPLSPIRRRVAVRAGLATVIATLPTLVLSPLHQTHHLSDLLFHLATGLCLGFSIALLITAVSLLIRNRTTC
jgi:hypothetical protein